MDPKVLDAIDLGCALAQEAVRDIARETGVTPSEAARIAQAGMEQWQQHDISDDQWVEALDAAESHLRAVAGGRDA